MAINQRQAAPLTIKPPPCIFDCMSFKPEDRIKGGQAVAKKLGSAYMRKIGKRGRAKQLKALKESAPKQS